MQLWFITLLLDILLVLCIKLDIGWPFADIIWRVWRKEWSIDLIGPLFMYYINNMLWIFTQNNCLILRRSWYLFVFNRHRTLYQLDSHFWQGEEVHWAFPQMIIELVLSNIFFRILLNFSSNCNWNHFITL